MAKDPEKRKRIMQRSIRLGHCICDAAKPCPCDLFKQKDICLCAGERLEVPSGPVALTRLVEKAGCASKIDQAFLKATLQGLPSLDDPRVLVGMPAGDDAGVYELDDGTALVQTVDVFTPSVDDPYQFGQVAAANSLSDIYAMGGRPVTALSIIGFPVRKVSDSVLRQILRGGIDKMKEAGVPVIGGHSIDDDQIKAGFAVTGIIDKNRVATNAGARVGDVLILTKPLGTGIVAFARQIGRAKEESLAAAVRSMTALNRSAAGQMERHQVHSCTDVTGFGLMGHLSEMALRSGVDVEICWTISPGSLTFSSMRRRASCRGRLNGTRNRAATGSLRAKGSERSCSTCASTPRPPGACSWPWTRRPPCGCSETCTTPALRIPASSGRCGTRGKDASTSKPAEKGDCP